MEGFSDEIFWIVVVGFVFAFVLAFGIGANDVANSFGTSVGSKVLTLGQACLLATVFEIAGAVLIGYKVSDTMRKGILDVSLYENGGEKQLACGCLAALIAGAIWLILATALGLPVSGTHSVVGATVGFSLAAKGTAGIKWNTLIAIVISWFVSPILSGTASAALYWFIKKLILTSKKPLNAGLISLPFFYGATVMVNVLSVVMDGPKLLHMDNIPLWLAFLASSLLGMLVAVLVQLFLVPHWRRKLGGSTNSQLESKVNFTFGASNETTPLTTPIHSTHNEIKTRPTSLISDECKLGLDRISETAEMVTLSDIDTKQIPNQYEAANLTVPFSPNGFNEAAVKNRALIASIDDCSLLSRSFSPQQTYLKRDNMLSLNNVDLTVTSLNFIDETLSNSKSIDSTQLCGVGESYGSGHSYLKNSTDTMQKSGVPTLLTSLFHPSVENGFVGSAKGLTNGKKKAIDCQLSEVQTLKPYIHQIDSGASLDLGLINPALTPNSSAVPLILDKHTSTGADTDAVDVNGHPHQLHTQDSEGIMKLFSFLQVLTATFGSFAHGGNDVSNAIGPLIALWLLYTDGSAHAKAETPIGILVYGGVGIAVGLWIWGRKVIQTVGTDLTSITPDTGFTIEIGSALTVLIASKAGLPISTTHCKVGSVVLVGAINSRNQGVDWKLFRNIIYAWITTVPVVAGISSLAMFLLDTFVV